MIPITSSNLEIARQLFPLFFPAHKKRESSASLARKKLVALLRHAYSGELGAINAYIGHRISVTSPTEKEDIRRIQQEEVEHRELVGKILAELGETPDTRLDWKMELIGRTIALLCQIGGWFIPMYGAGALERINIQEYEDAARLAWEAGLTNYLDDLLTMAECEWEHERYFREQCQTHFLSRVIPMWCPPPEKASIRKPFEHLQFPCAA